MNHYMCSRKEPLHPNILAESFPPNFMVPCIKLYKRMIDHINMVLVQMVAQPITDALLCRLFLGTPKGGASVQWFFDLPTRSITCFLDLYLKFVALHIEHKRMKMRNSYLMTLE